jgi:endonuclease YncB( thermonuclease family)
MGRGIMIGVVLAAAGGALMGSTPAPHPPFENVEIVDCYDGDTCTVNLPGLPAVFGWHLPVRLAGIDTPEIKGKCPHEKELAIKARDLVRRTLKQAARVDLADPQRDKYFRLGAQVIADGRNISAILLEEGLAVPYSGGHKEATWCA